MKTKTLILFLTLVAFSYNVKAQLTGKKFELKTEQMGTLVWSFTEKDYAVSIQNGETIVTGNYKIEKDTVIISDEKGQQACSGGSVGKYKFSL